MLSIILTKKIKIGEKDIKIDQLILLDFLVLNSFFLISTTNFLELLLTLEINNILFIILSTTRNFQLSSTEAAFKYFFISALTTSIYLLGVFILWSITGQLAFDEIKVYLFHYLEHQTTGLFFNSWFHFNFCIFFIKVRFLSIHKFLIDFYGNVPFIFLPFFQIFGQFLY